jgi:hypothetical protein
VFRSRGGGGERDNRVTVCAAHHHHGLHRGLVRASGQVSSGLEWELGTQPLLRVSGRGEVYLPVAV